MTSSHRLMACLALVLALAVTTTACPLGFGGSGGTGGVAAARRALREAGWKVRLGA